MAGICGVVTDMGIRVGVLGACLAVTGIAYVQMGHRMTSREIASSPRAAHARGVVPVARALWIGVGENVLHAIALGMAALGLAAGGVIAALDALPGFQDVYLGAGTGVLVAKLVVAHVERRRGEMPELRRRQLEARWLIAGLAIGVVLFVIVDLL